mmetsp:Transcript_20574/g.36975  ORF Transcript_20574/g.36975 Transcript_20574/m.36975 type:complete len:107 (-) Transcript_20574:315-635(-)
MMRSLLTILFIATVATAFTSPGANTVSLARSTSSNTPSSPTTSTTLFIDMGEPERKALTRETEPDEFFSTNTDKMSDAEKIPIALMGLAGISLPFIAGMIALYAAK